MPELVYKLSFELGDVSGLEKIQTVSQAIASMQRGGTSGGSSAIKQQTQELTEQEQAVRDLYDEFSKFQTLFKNYESEVRASGRANSEMTATLRMLSLEAESFRNEANELSDVFDRNSEDFKMMSSVFQSGGSVIQRSSELIKKFSEETVAAGSAYNQVGATLAGFEQRQKIIIGKIINDRVRLRTADTVTAEKIIQNIIEQVRSLGLLDNEMKDYIQTASMTVEEQIKLNNTMIQSGKIYDENAQLLKISYDTQGRFVEAGQNTAVMTRGMNAQFSLANQSLFSLSDLIQDSTQFSYGFATGMRAVGNNIGYTAELFAVLAQKVKESNEATGQNLTIFQSLRKAVAGPAGLIVAINVAVTVVTMLSKAFNDNKKEVEEATTSVLKYEKALASALGQVEAFGEDPFGVQQTSFLLEIVSRQLREAGEAFFGPEEERRLRNLQSQYGDIVIVAGSASEADQRLKKERLSSEIEILEKRKEQSSSQEQINELQEKQRELADELAISLGIINDLQYQNALFIKTSKDNFESWIKTVDTMPDVLKDIAKGGEELISEDSFVSNYLERITMERFNALDRQNEEYIQKLKLNAEIEIQLERDKSDAIVSIRRSMLSSLSSLSSAFAKDNKALAIGILAIEKGLRIAEVIINAKKEIGLITASAATGNPIAVARLASIPFIKAAAAASVAEIAATGLQSAKSISGANSGGGAGASSGSGVTKSKFGFESNVVEGSQTFRTPAFTPVAQSAAPKIIVNNELRADRKQLYILTKQGEEEYRSIQV